jgi:organic hydroperoxide reductase OsmC/OhrA
MHRYEARISWTRDGARFTDNRYGRGHEWSFDGGVKASASPSVVPLPYSVADAVDPEEALVAAASSCHMLSFLFIAAKRGFVVDNYVDDAFGVMEKNAGGKLFISRITLRPEIQFSGESIPTDAQLQSLHHAAHEECFIANSLKSKVVIEPANDTRMTGRIPPPVFFFVSTVFPCRYSSLGCRR